MFEHVHIEIYQMHVPILHKLYCYYYFIIK